MLAVVKAVTVDFASAMRQPFIKSGDLSPIYIGLVLKQLGLPKDAMEG